MGQVGHLVDGLDLPRRRAEDFRRVPLVASHEAFLLRGLFEQAGDPPAGKIRQGPFVPAHIEGVAPLLCRPVAVGHDGNTAGVRHDMPHAEHAPRGRFIVACRLAAEDGAALYGGREQARPFHVESQDGAPVHLERGVQAVQPLSEQIVLIRAFQLDVLRDWLQGGPVGQLAVCQFRPLGPCATVPFSAWQEAASTRHTLAAAATSIIRAAAPARPSGSQKPRTLELPPVSCVPMAGFV